MKDEPTPPSIPYRPFKKIMARGPQFPPTSKIQVGDKVRVSKKEHFKHWRLYEITSIDGDTCRLVTLDKRFAMTTPTELLQKMKDLGMLDKVETGT